MCFFRFFLLVAALLAHTTAWAQTTTRLQGLIVNAERSYRDLENETLDLEGKVQVIFGSQHLRANRVKVQVRSRTLEAEGDVVIVTPEATYGGRFVKLDYETNTGFIVDGFVQSQSVLLEGLFLQKLGPREFYATDAKYTSCENCPETWKFSGSRVKAELGGYAFIKNSFFYIGGVPIFWFPYLVVPLVSERQSGLLTPSFDHDSDSGLIFSQPFFWAMSRSQDSTWTLQNYENRGQKLHVNYRYMLTERSYGDLDTAFMRDRHFGTRDRLNAYRSQTENGVPIPRWFIRYKHYYELPENFVHRLQVNSASDLQYPNDFPLESTVNGEGFLENRTSITKNFTQVHSSLDSSYYINLLQSDPLSTNNDSVHRLPDLRVSQVDTRVGETDFFYSWDLRYAHFTRSGFSYDEMNSRVQDLTSGQQRRLRTTQSTADCATDRWEVNPNCQLLRSGLYQSDKDLIRTGQRADGVASITRPLQASGFDILPKVSYRETHYLFDVGAVRNNVRRYLRGELSVRTPFSKLYKGTPDKDTQFTYKHEIQPEVTYSALPWIDHPAHPFFGGYSSADIPAYLQEYIADSNFNSPYGVQFDYDDRLLDRKILTYGFTNRIVEKKSLLNGENIYATRLSWKLAQIYDMFQAESSDPLAQPYSDIVSELIITLSQTELYQKANYYPYQQVTDTSSRIKFFNEKSESVSLTHNLSFPIVRGKSVNYSGRNEEFVLAGKKVFTRFDLVAQAAYDLNPLGSQRFKNFGYAVQVKLPGNCAYLTLLQYLNPQGIYGWKIKFDFSWDGKPVPSLPESIVSGSGGASPYSPSSF